MQVDWYWVSALPTAMWSAVAYLPFVMICFANSLILPLPWQIKTSGKKICYLGWLLFAMMTTAFQTGMCLLTFRESDWTLDEKLCIYFNLVVFDIVISYMILMFVCLIFKQFRKTRLLKIIIRFLTYLICWWGVLELFILPSLINH
ncbi:hypothetical protein IJJ08_01140 [bacterium]|nr:hypothetical protein [bacterium]